MNWQICLNALTRHESRLHSVMFCFCVLYFTRAPCRWDVSVAVEAGLLFACKSGFMCLRRQGSCLRASLGPCVGDADAEH